MGAFSGTGALHKASPRPFLIFKQQYNMMGVTRPPTPVWRTVTLSWQLLLIRLCCRARPFPKRTPMPEKRLNWMKDLQRLTCPDRYETRFDSATTMPLG